MYVTVFFFVCVGEDTLEGGKNTMRGTRELYDGLGRNRFLFGSVETPTRAEKVGFA